MQKHQPVGWFEYDEYDPMNITISDDTNFEDLFNKYTFADGTPFGIKEE